MLDSFKVAIDKAQQVLNELDYGGECMVDTNKVRDIVSKITDVKIQVGESSFSQINKNVANMGAMMNYNSESKEAKIILNSDVDAKFSRFSLIHELGHLITERYTSSKGKYTISAHINYKLTDISEEQCKSNTVLENEQIANIFSLLVLMPKKQLWEKINSTDNISEVASFFGVEKDCVISRTMLGY